MTGKGECRWTASEGGGAKVFVIGQVFRLKVADILNQGCDCGAVLRWEWGNSGCSSFVMWPTNSTRTHNSAVTSSTAELGSTGKFWGPHVDPDDGADAVCMCGVLLAHRDDKAGQFEQEGKRGHSRGQFTRAGHSGASCAASVAAWCLGVGGHSGDDGDGNGDNGGSSGSDARGRIAKVG